MTVHLLAALVVGLALLSVMGAGTVQPARLGFTVTPPGPVTDRINVELRAGIRNTGGMPHTARVLFHADRRTAPNLVADRTVTVPPGESRMVSAWWDPHGKVGAHRMLCRVEINGVRKDLAWPLNVVACPTRALPYFQGAWIDGYGGMDPETVGAAAVERELRLGVDAMHRLGMRVLIYTYPEWYGKFYYPGTVEFFDRDIGGPSRASSCRLDAIGIILSQAEKNGQHVMVGLGRQGDLHLLWEFDRADWPERNRRAIEVAKQVASELWSRYGSRKSFYGWYLTHEMNDLAKAGAYYDPVAEHCRALAPDKPVLIAPAGTPIWTRETIRASRVDIIAPQDAVGSGYMPYVNTWDPSKRIANLDQIYSGYRDLHDRTGKHLWTDLEIWEMDGTHGYGHAYPPGFSRVRQQIDIEKNHVDMLTAYTYFGYMQHPGRKVPGADARAVKLYDDYLAYLRALPGGIRPPAVGSMQ
jgi:hypothetical protein